MKKILLLFILVFSFNVFGQDAPDVATFTVTNLNDSGAGSLRQAISDAGIVDGDDVINFQSGLTGAINLTSGELLINSNVTINGNNGITITRSTTTDTPYFRILNVTSGATVSINYLTISGGNLSMIGALGGGIYNAGNLSISNSTISNNRAGCSYPACNTALYVLNGSGGGIYNTGVLTLSGSTVSDNISGATNDFPADNNDGIGGGITNLGTITINYSNITKNTTNGCIYNTSGGNAKGGGVYNSGTAIITNSSISNNNAAATMSFGGGIYNISILNITASTINNNTAQSPYGHTNNFSAGGGILNTNQLNISNSTISNNKSGSYTGLYRFPVGGGGIYAGGPTVIRNSTISGNIQNTEPYDQAHELGGGIYGGAIISNTIVAGNFGYYGEKSDFSGGSQVQSEGNNLIGTVNNSSGWIASDILNQDSKLAPLAYNGGFTQTQALLAGSPAINAGNNANAPATDQRGFARIVGGTIDIGAYESDTPASTPTPTPTPIVTPTPKPTVTPSPSPSPTPTPSPTPSETPPPPPPTNCTYSINPASQSFPSTGGNGSVSVITQQGCIWSADNVNTWINLTNVLNGSLFFTVDANSTNSARIGTFTVAGQTFTVNQSAYSKSRKRIRFF